MKKLINTRTILAAVAAIIVIMQFFRPDQTNPVSDPAMDYLAVAAPPAEISLLIREGCYDCHSNQTRYPWYSRVAPVSWIISSHVREGRAHLNFSEWGSYQSGRRGHKTDECREMTENKEMPLKGYTLMHSGANFSESQRESLKKWFTVE